MRSWVNCTSICPEFQSEFSHNDQGVARRAGDVESEANSRRDPPLPPLFCLPLPLCFVCPHLIFQAQRPPPTTIPGFPRCHSIGLNAARFAGRFWRSNKNALRPTSTAAPEIQNPRCGSPAISAARHRRERPPNPRAHRGPARRRTAPAPAVAL